MFGYTNVVELSDLITCPRTSKWSKYTCPTKSYLPENCHLILCLEENICCGYPLEEPQCVSNEYPQYTYAFFEK